MMRAVLMWPFILALRFLEQRWRSEGLLVSQLLMAKVSCSLVRCTPCSYIDEDDISCVQNECAVVHFCSISLCAGGQQRVCFLGDEVEVAMGTMRPSGDHVYVSGGSNYFFVGRQDGQRKRHGKRLELGSVERVRKQ